MTSDRVPPCQRRMPSGGGFLALVLRGSPRQSRGRVKTVPSLLALLLTTIMPSFASETFYLGTYTHPGKSDGIYRYELDPATGAVTEHGLAVKSASPSFLALHPGGKFLYAVNEIDKGTVSAFAIESDGALRELNRQPSRGNAPTHLALDHAGRCALVANYNSGSVAALPIHDDGTLGEVTGLMKQTGFGPDKLRQEAPHAHSVYVSADDTHVFSCDLGLDRVFKYRLEAATGGLAAGEPPFTAMAPASGPRHLSLTPGDKRIYVVEEMANAIEVLEREESGAYRLVQKIGTLPEEFHGSSTAAEIALHPNGRFLYCTNRGHDSLAAFSVNETNGRLTLLGHTSTQGQGPRFFTIDPSGNFLLAANQTSGDVFVFRLDQTTGALKPTGYSFRQSEPVCIVFTGR